MVVDEGVYKAIIVGGGPSGIGVFIRAARTGFLARLLNPVTHGTAKDNELSTRLGLKQKGVAVIHAGGANTFGSGNLGEYVNNSNTFACSLLASVLDEKPELDPPESVKNTFLENARTHDSAKRLEEIGTATANLTEIGRFLHHVGTCILKEVENNAPDTSKCLLSTAATKYEALENGLIRVEAKCTNGNGETVVLLTEHLVLAMGGVQELPSLDNPAYHSKLFASDACLREDGFVKLKEHLLAQPTGDRKVCIVGGSHSSFSVAWLLLNKFADPKAVTNTKLLTRSSSPKKPPSVVSSKNFDGASAETAPVDAPVIASSPLTVTKNDSTSVKMKRTSASTDGSVSTSTIFKPKDIVIVHRSPIRCYYASKKEAEADSIEASRVDRSGCVNTFTGLREDAKRLYKSVLAGRETRVKLLQVNQNSLQVATDKIYAAAGAIVWGAGYKTNVLPGFDEAGKPLSFLQDNGVIKLDNKARLQLLGTYQAKCPSVLGLGLGFSLRSAVDEMGTQTRVDGVTIYHRRGAALVLEALFGPNVYGTSTSFEEMVEKNEKKKRDAQAAKAEKAAEKLRNASEGDAERPASPSKSHIFRSSSVTSHHSSTKLSPLVHPTPTAGRTAAPVVVRRSPSKPGPLISPVDKKSSPSPKKKDLISTATNPPVKMLLNRRRNSADEVGVATPTPSLEPSDLSSTPPENAAAALVPTASDASNT